MCRDWPSVLRTGIFPHKKYSIAVVFEYTSYFVTVDLSDTYGATGVVGKLFRDVGTPRVSFVLPSSALLFSSRLSLVLFPFRM